MKLEKMKFEDIVNSSDGEIFEKTKILSKVLSSRATGNECLGAQILEKISGQPLIKEKNGKVHKVIMLGSNSYLNLTTHPQVMEGAKKALEKYGYGMGAVSLYAGISDLHKVVYTTAICSDFDGEAINIIDEKRTSINEYYQQTAREYFAEKTFTSITLPFWLGKIIGKISTTLTNLLGRTTELFDPTFYSVHHVAFNLDFSCKKQNEVLSKYKELSRRAA